MGKGAGGCDDRPTLLLAEPVLAGERAEYFDGEEHHLSDSERLAAALVIMKRHRQRFPLVDLFPLGSPYTGDDSDRVRFRKMLKHMEAAGYRVWSWEANTNDPQIVFSLPSPQYDPNGYFKRVSQLQVTVSSDDDEIKRFVQESLHLFGFYAVISLTGKISVIHTEHPPSPLHVLLTEHGVQMGFEWMLTQHLQIDLTDEQELARYSAFLQSAQISNPQDWLPYSEIGITEAESWHRSDIAFPVSARQWGQVDFTPREAQQWSGWGTPAFAEAGRSKNQLPVEAFCQYAALSMGSQQALPLTSGQWATLQSMTDPLNDFSVA